MDPRTPPLLAFDEFAIDFAGHRLLRDGVEQPLEPKAFGVLALLAGSPGQVFARDEILDAVWGHRHVTPGVLNRVMTLLRHALGEDAQGARYLHTVHGVGYRFDLPEAAMAAATPSAQTIEPRAESVVAQPPMRRASDKQRASRRMASWSLLLLATLAFAAWTWWPRATPATAVPATERSIAVLPLTNASRDPDQQFFSDGLSDNLIDALSRFEGLKVIGRMSSFQFRDGAADAKTVGAKLGAAYLLSGSVQRAGDVVRINTTLTKAADGSTLWAEHYDRPYQDLFALQDDIARSVARALQARLLPTSAIKPNDRPPSGNIEAYTAYLQGSKYWHEENFPKAAEFMTRAVQLDPDYAVAWADLSGSWSTVAAFWNEPPAEAREHMRLAREAADKALQLAPALGSAHAARAYLMFTAFDDRGALAECRRAVELSPNDPMVLNGCGFVLTGIGKLAEALRLRERLLSIEPLYSVNTFQYATLLMASGRLDEAEKYLRIAEGLSGPSVYAHMVIAMLRGDAAAAMKFAAQAPDDQRALLLALATQIGPDRAAADAALATVLHDKVVVHAGNHSVDYRSPYQIAKIYALRGDAGHALQWLERAPPSALLFMLADPLLLRFRDDPRFIALCKKLGLPPPSESDALGIDQIRAQLAAKR